MIQRTSVVIEESGPGKFDGYQSFPSTGSGPGMLIFSEMWGVSEKKCELADEYARRGWCALVPNMFWRSSFKGLVPFENPDLAWSRLQEFDWEVSVDDCRSAARYLRSQQGCNGKIGAIGFCMGGRLAFLTASRVGIDAAVGLYALGIAKHLDEVRNMAVPMQLHYGLSDEHIPAAEIEAVRGAAANNKWMEIKLYEGAGHGFFNRTFSKADEDAVVKATDNIDLFFSKIERR
jgi:carboxymethylenebutenolidase